MAYDFSFMENLKTGSIVGKFSLDYNLHPKIELATVEKLTKSTVTLETGETFFKKDGMKLGTPGYRTPRLISETRARKLLGTTEEDRTLSELAIEVLKLFSALPGMSPGLSRAEVLRLGEAHSKAARLIEDYVAGKRKPAAPAPSPSVREEGDPVAERRPFGGRPPRLRVAAAHS